MVNLFAFRATRPDLMKANASPVGPDNDRWLVDVARDAGVVVAAWGVDGIHLHRDKEVARLLSGRLSCLSITKGGHPGHPLYLNRSLKPVPYPEKCFRSRLPA
jgi:hypothetical protein